MAYTPGYKPGGFPKKDPAAETAKQKAIVLQNACGHASNLEIYAATFEKRQIKSDNVLALAQKIANFVLTESGLE